MISCQVATTFPSNGTGAVRDIHWSFWRNRRSFGSLAVIHRLFVFWISHLLVSHRLCITLLPFLYLLLIFVFFHWQQEVIISIYFPGSPFFTCVRFLFVFFGFFANNCTCRKMKDPIVSIRALWITAENQRLLSLIIVFPQLCPHLLTLLFSSSNNANSHSRHRGPAQLPQQQSWGPQRGASAGSEWCGHLKLDRAAGSGFLTWANI